MRLFTQALGFTNTSVDLFDSLLQLPSEIHGVVGDTLQIYYNAMIVAPYSYYVRVTCSVGDDLLRYYEVTPTVAGTYSFKIELLSPDYEVITTKTASLIIKEAVQQPSVAHQFWAVGDSLTAGGIWDGEMLRRLTGTGGAPAGNAFGNITNHTEGQSGKTWEWFVSDETSPFVYSGVLDFEQYRVDNALSVPKSMYILLTWNGMSGFRNQGEWDTWDDNVYTFINAVKADFPSCDIILMSPQLPSLTGGLGAVYGALGEYYSDLFLGIINAKKQAQIYDRIIGETGYEHVEHIGCALQVDSLNNMPYATKDTNVRNSTDTEKIGNNGVHPSTSGYYQFGDSAYRHFINKYCQ